MPSTWRSQRRGVSTRSGPASDMVEEGDPKAFPFCGIPPRSKGANYELNDGDVVIAAITSCTNTSNPAVLIAAGLLARNARAKGLSVKPWVRTSLAPGSQVVTDYLEKAGLQDDLDALGFHLVGYGCTTCIGNSGPLPEEIAEAVQRERSRGLLSAFRQPQLRRPHQSRTSRPTGWPLRRWSSPMRSRDRSTSMSRPMRSARTRTESLSI